MFNVEMDICNQQPRVAVNPVSTDRIVAGKVNNADAAFGFAGWPGAT